jgi:hypothetical protein
MPLIFPKPPIELGQVFEAGLLHLVQLGRVPAGLSINPNPQPICLLSLKDGVDNFQLPTAPIPVNWRYFAGDLSGPVVAGDIIATTPPVIAGLLYGDTAKRALQASLALASLAETQASDYEPFLLRIPGALVEAFWLKPSTDGTPWIVPFGPTFDPTHRQGAPITVDGFLHTLRPVAPQVFRT